MNGGELVKRGQDIYKMNTHFRKLATVMEHPEFRAFFDEYLSDWDTAKTILMFMKLYEAVEKHSNVVLTPYQKVAIIHDMINDGNLRSKIVEGVQKWMDDTTPRIQDK